MQCMAPGLDGLQCWGKVQKDRKFHCDEHVSKASSLYQTYKKLCDIAHKFVIEDFKKQIRLKDQITFLNRCYYVFTRAYEGRLEHRKYSFIPKYYDHGHDHQLKKLLELIDLCEFQLERIYNELIESNKNLATKKETVEDKQTESELIVVVLKVQNFKKQRQLEEKEMQRLFDLYIKSNEQEVQQRSEIIQVLQNKIEFTKQEEMFIIIQVLIVLRNWNYFSSYSKINSLKFLKIEALPKTFSSFAVWIDNNYKTSDICDFITLIDMYQKEILEVVDDWTFQTYKTTALIWECDKWKLTNQNNLGQQYSSMAKCKHIGVNTSNIANMDVLMKCKGRKLGRLLNNNALSFQSSFIKCEKDMTHHLQNEYDVEKLVNRIGKMNLPRNFYG